MMSYFLYMSGLILCLSMLYIPIWGDDLLLMPMEVDPPMERFYEHGENPEKNLEAVESHFIQNVFLKDMLPENTSLLSEQEQEELPMSFQGGTEREILIRELSKKLAKQDILNLKRLINHARVIPKKYPN